MRYPRRALGRLRCERGVSLAEYLVVLPLSLLVLGLALGGFEQGVRRSQEVDLRSQAMASLQVGLERMTRELRQASWVHFSSSAIVDFETMVRTDAGTAVARHVRYDCSPASQTYASLGLTDCLRSEGPPTAYPPTTAPSGTAVRIVEGVAWPSVFVPRRMDTTTGLIKTDFVTPDQLEIRLRVSRRTMKRPIDLRGSVALRNRAATG